jgi:predicted permease
LPQAKYDSPEKLTAFQDQLLARMRALPGVTTAALTSNLPFSGSNNQGSYSIDGYTPPTGQPGPHGMIRQVSPDYFKAIGITLLRGRTLTERDTRNAPDVVVIDRYLADRYWPGKDPIGQHIVRGSLPNPVAGQPRLPRKWEIVGVVATIKQFNLEEPVGKETLYFPLAQQPGNMFTLVLKTAVAPNGLMSAARNAILAIDPEQPLFDVKTMATRLDDAMQARKAPMILLSLFAGIALLLAALGVYGVLAFAVGQRTPEIGIRVALGATRADILRLILRQGAGLVLLGVLLGLAGYFGLSTVIGRMLFGVAPTDLGTLLIAPAVLLLVALAACLIPARGATKVDPMVALRAE